jgi:hypothetical protein
MYAGLGAAAVCDFGLQVFLAYTDKIVVSGRRGKHSKISKVLTVYMMSGIGLWLGGNHEEIFGGPCTHVVAWQSCASFNLPVHSLCFS